jgi:hypothetical protein
LVNAATANYGFFCWLATVLHVFLLDDRDVAWLRARAGFDSLVERVLDGRRKLITRSLEIALACAFVIMSTIEAIGSFTQPGPWFASLEPLRAIYAPLRICNTYHLFGHITRERIEPVLETFDGTTWSEQSMNYKPGPLDRRPPYVAPHQPRVDFQLWFYGLDYARGTPPYVSTLLERVCHDPEAIASLFAAPLPGKPQAVRLKFYRYRFSEHFDKRWWTREPDNETRPIPCR